MMDDPYRHLFSVLMDKEGSTVSSWAVDRDAAESWFYEACRPRGRGGPAG